MRTQHVILKPIISEKSLKDAYFGKYTFLVQQKSNKTEIKRAIEQAFEVKVTKIMTNLTKGSIARNTKIGKKVSVFANKKAVVILADNAKIDIFEEHLGNETDKSKDKKSKVKKEEEK
jgi:large subunit ribosomal protein L23